MTNALEGVAKITDVEGMIKGKASKIEQTELRQAINGLKIELAPLIEKGHTLRNFINSVNKEAEKELKLDQFTQRLEQIKHSMKNMSENFDRDVESFSERISSVENSVLAFKEELIA